MSLFGKRSYPPSYATGYMRALAEWEEAAGPRPWQRCPVCRGRGSMQGVRCRSCDGKGMVR